MGSRTTITVLAALAITLASWLGWTYWTSTPEYALAQIQRAVDTRDSVRFEKYVDIDSVVTRATDTLMEQALRETKGSNDVEEIGSALAAGMIAMMKPKIVEYTKSKISMMIEDSGEPAATDQQANVGQIDQILELHGNEVKALPLRKSGRVAYLDLEYLDEEFDEWRTLEIKLRDIGDHWQVVEISNLAEYMEESELLRDQKLAALNSPIEARLQETISVIQVSKESIEEHGNKKTRMTLVVKNLSKRDLKEFALTLDTFDLDGGHIKDLNLTGGMLAANTSKPFVWELDVNQFRDEDARLFVQDRPRYRVTLNKVEFYDGEVVKRIKSL